MPILLVNDTDGDDVAWNISGVKSNGSTKMIVSGGLSESGYQSVPVSGYISYDVQFFPVGFTDKGTYTVTRRVTNNTTCVLGVTVFAGVDQPASAAPAAQKKTASKRKPAKKTKAAKKK